MGEIRKEGFTLGMGIGAGVADYKLRIDHNLFSGLSVCPS